MSKPNLAARARSSRRIISAQDHFEQLESARAKVCQVAARVSTNFGQSCFPHGERGPLLRLDQPIRGRRAISTRKTVNGTCSRRPGRNTGAAQITPAEDERCSPAVCDFLEGGPFNAAGGCRRQVFVNNPSRCYYCIVLHIHIACLMSSRIFFFCVGAVVAQMFEWSQGPMKGIPLTSRRKPLTARRKPLRTQ